MELKDRKEERGHLVSRSVELGRLEGESGGKGEGKGLDWKLRNRV